MSRVDEYSTATIISLLFAVAIGDFLKFPVVKKFEDHLKYVNEQMATQMLPTSSLIRLRNEMGKMLRNPQLILLHLLNLLVLLFYFSIIVGFEPVLTAIPLDYSVFEDPPGSTWLIVIFFAAAILYSVRLLFPLLQYLQLLVDIEQATRKG